MDTEPRTLRGLGAVMRRWSPFREEDSSRTKSDVGVGMLLIQWGNSGAGPRLLTELADELSRVSSNYNLYISYNTNSEVAAGLRDLGVETLPVTTYQSRLGVITGIPRLLIQCLALRSFVKDHEIAVAYSPMFSVWQSLAVRLYLPRNVQYVSSIHDAVAHTGDERLVWRLCRTSDIRRSAGIVTFSREVGRIVKNATGRPVLTTVHPAFASRSTPTVRKLPNGRPVVVGFFGRIVAYKGVDLLLDSMGYLDLDIQRRLRIDVYGSGDTRHLEKYKDSPQVNFHFGWIAEGDVEAVLDQFDILVLPYREASQSGVLALAMSRGIPVVCTPVGALPEQVSATGIGEVADEVSSEALAEALSRLMSDSTRYEAASRAGLAASSGCYSWERVARDIRRFCEELQLQGGGSGDKCASRN